MSAAFPWRVVAGERHHQFLVDGALLAHAFCGRCRRFELREIRCRDAEGIADRRYEIADAEAISDADVRAGKRPPVVARFDDLDAALEFINAT